MTTYYQFVPSNAKAPTFMPTLDGNQYNITITWNISAKRYYVNCFELDGTLIFSVPLVGTYQPIEILALEWDEANSRVVGTTSVSHIFKIGQTIFGTIINAMPNTYNGTGFITILNSTQFAYPMVNDPGVVSFCGSIEFLISVTKAYFNSTMVYRQKRFEVTP